MPDATPRAARPGFRRLVSWAIRQLELQRHNARLLSMEGLRGVAVLLVFLIHYLEQALILAGPGVRAPLTTALKLYGNNGVELFFILSGYLIYGSLIRNRPAFLPFMWRRAVRIYPAFLVAFLISLAGQWHKVPDGNIAAYLIGNLTFLPGLFPLQPQVAVAWTLSYEVFFYIGTAIVIGALALDRRSRLVRVGAILGLAAILSAGAVMIAGFPLRMAGFLAGMLLFEGRGRFVRPLLGLAAPIAAFGVGVLLPMPEILREWMNVLALAALCSACFRDQGPAARLLSWNPLRWLGNMSYSYYLVHGYVTSVFSALLGHFFGNVPLFVSWDLLPAAFVLTLLPSFLLFVLVERPLSLPDRGRAALPGGASRKRIEIVR